MSGPYLGYTCSVLKPYFLHVEVLLAEECMEQVWFRYVSYTEHSENIYFFLFSDKVVEKVEKI